MSSTLTSLPLSTSHTETDDLKPFSRNENDPRPSMGKVVLISTIAALAFTAGATIAVLPGLRARQRSTASRFQFLSNRGMSRPAMAPRPIVKPRTDLKASNATPKEHYGSAAEWEMAESILAEGEVEEPISPLYAIKAFAIATAIVTGSAAVISIGTARLLGVQNMEEFTSKMRQYTSSVLPTQRIYAPALSSSSGSSGPGEERTEEDHIVSGWFKGVVEGAEEERKEIVRSRGIDFDESGRERVV